MNQPQLTLRRADDRGTTDLDWLYSRHSFSFGQYHDPANTRFRVLRVINDDVIQPGEGFGKHGHDNMEIMTWVLSGALKHGDSLGNMQELRPGELQVMTAGSGIRHSEFNASKAEPVHLLQIWLFPNERDVKPRYVQQAFDAAARFNQWNTLASGRSEAESGGGAVVIQQDAALRVADVEPGRSVPVKLDEGRYGYLHLATGEVNVPGHALAAGDAVTFTGPGAFEVAAKQASQVLLFDLP